MTELAPFEFAEATETGLNIRPDCPFDAWRRMGETLDRIGGAWQWWYGDWWNIGESRYGEKHAQALPAKDYQTKANAASVAGRIELSRRRENLSFSHHAEVAYLEPVEQDEWLDRAQAEQWTRNDLRREIRVASRQLVPPPPIEDEPDVFSTIVADPPWRYDNVATRGAAEDHYPTMTIEELCALEVPAADNAHLYLWTTNGFLREAFDVMDAWGFTYKTTLTWCKPQIGMGNWFRNTTEHVLFGVRGKLPTNANDRPTHFVANRTRHSEKPDAFYDLVEVSSPGPYYEMFARRRRLGWHTWGNEA